MEKEERADWQGVDGRFISSCSKRCIIYSHNNNTIMGRNEACGQMHDSRERCITPFFSFFLRPSVAETRERRLPRCQHLTPDVFSCPRCLSQTKRKINNAFPPPFPLWCNFKKPMDGPPEALKRREKKNQRYETSSEWKYRGKTSPYTLKMLLTSEPQVAKPKRQGAQGWTNISFYY